MVGDEGGILMMVEIKRFLVVAVAALACVCMWGVGIHIMTGMTDVVQSGLLGL